LTTLTTLQHRSIVRYCNFWVDECNELESQQISETFCLNPPINQPSSFLFIQMDRCDGRSLEDLLHKMRFFDDRIQWRIGRQILEAMHYLHSNNFVHYAISTKNIFLTTKMLK